MALIEHSVIQPSSARLGIAFCWRDTPLKRCRVDRRHSRLRRLVRAAGRRRRVRSSSRGRLPIPPPASDTTSKRPPGSGFPTADISIASQSLGILGSTIDFKKDLGLTDQHFPEVHLELRPATRHKFRFQYIPIKYDQSGVLHAQYRLQRSELYGRAAGQLDARLEGVPVRLRVRLHLPRPRIRRVRPGLQVHRRHGDAFHAELADRVRVHAGEGADSGHRRHLPRLRGAQHLDHGRSDRIQAARQR